MLIKRLIRYARWPSLCLLMVATAGASAATMGEESELKAAFVYNFTLFTTWPQAIQSLRVCVLGEPTLVLPLKRYEGRSANGMMVRVDHVKSATEARSCQVVFIDSSEHENIGSINKVLAGAPALTVAEAGKVTAASVHVLLVRDDDRISFEINQTAAKASGLNFSFKLLKLARKVHEGN
jgi:hypothetical protein